MELIFLGTGAGMPTKSRNVTAIALDLMQERGSYWLFDCGEATQHQILQTTVKPGKIEKLFITHLHGDHLYGLPGLLTSRSYLGGETPMTLYGPKGLRSFVETALSVSGAYLGYSLDIVELEGEGEVFADETFRVTSALLDHRIECFGYRIEQKDLPGPLQVEKLKQDGIPPGPIYRELQLGRSVPLADGRVLEPSDYVGAPRKGRVIVILGDTRYCENGVRLAQHADVLVHEATFGSEFCDLAGQYHHATCSDAATVAKEAGVHTLIFTHLSSRYQESDIDRLLEEARAVFPNAYAAHDFFSFRIEKAGKPL